MAITSLNIYCHPPSQVTHVNQPMQSPFFRKAWACFAKPCCCEGFLWERCVSSRCFLHSLTRRENWVPLERSVQLSTIIKMWQSQAGSHCLTVHHFARLPQGNSLQPGNTKIEHPLHARCYPAPLWQSARAHLTAYQPEPDILGKAGRNPEN